MKALRRVSIAPIGLVAVVIALAAFWPPTATNQVDIADRRAALSAVEAASGGTARDATCIEAKGVATCSIFVRRPGQSLCDIWTGTIADGVPTAARRARDVPCGRA